MNNINQTHDSLLKVSKDEQTKSKLKFELQLFSFIYNGDLNRVNDFLKIMNEKARISGRFSEDELRQAKYIAVAFASLAFRVAITGGIVESAAYKEIEKFVLTVDKMDDVEEVYDYISQTLIEITQAVHDLHYSINYSTVIRECTNYIYNHIYSKISLNQLAEVSGLTPSYLSSLFKKETGMTISDYIMKEKMKEATSLLLSEKYSCVEISKMLGFCSQSYFCKCFKTQYNLTPLEFIESPFVASNSDESNS